ncbi:hypothetical protein VNO77_13309 [Canavalia gladiata]|uniref:Uncharacterized protein n=1 Tax=Canavalia gladiata TaxID=3824 RepID=A0AAN9LXQ1_CANGL
MLQPPTQPSVASALFHHINAPAWITSWRYPTRHAVILHKAFIKNNLCHIPGNVGLANAKTNNGSKVVQSKLESGLFQQLYLILLHCLLNVITLYLTKIIAVNKTGFCLQVNDMKMHPEHLNLK